MDLHLRLIATLLAMAVWLTACSSPSATPEYTPALPTQSIAAPLATLDPYIPMTGFAVAPDGAVWFSLGNSDFHNLTAGGVSRYAQGRLTRFTIDDGLPNANVQALAIAPDGSVWMGAVDCAVARYDGQLWQTLNADCASIGGNVVDFAFRSDGSVWVATGMDLARFDGRTWMRFGKNAAWLVVDSDGALWANSWDWQGDSHSEYVVRFDGTDWTVVGRLPIGRLFTGPDDSVWANLTGRYSEHARLVRFDGRAWEMIPGPSFTSLLELAVAPNGELWAMTDQGFFQHNGTAWLQAGVMPEGITRFAFAADGSIWLGGNGGQLAHFQPATARLDFVVTPVPTITPPPTLLAPSGLAPSPSVTPVPQLPVTHLAITPDGAVWHSFGALEFHPRGGGIVRDHQGQTTRFTMDTGLPGNNVQLLKVAPDGALWVSGWEGTQGSQYVARFDGVSNWSVECIAASQFLAAPGGALWSFQNTSTLARFDGQTWRIFTELPFQHIDNLAFNADGILWLATGGLINRSAYRLSTPRAGAPPADPPPMTESPASFAGPRPETGRST